MSTMPDFEIVRHFQTLPRWAKTLGLLAVFALTAVFSFPLIASQGKLSYVVVLVAVPIIAALLLFVSPDQTEIRNKTEDKKSNQPPLSSSTSQPSEKQEVVVQQKKRREDVLHKLTHDEKEFLAPYIFKDVTSQYSNVMGGIYQSLFKKQIVDPPASVGYMTYRDVLIQDWAKDYLAEHTELLKGFENAQPRIKPHWH